MILMKRRRHMSQLINLAKPYLWRSGKNAWVILASKLEGFEEHAFKACYLILNGDPRIGRVGRGRSTMP